MPAVADKYADAKTKYGIKPYALEEKHLTAVQLLAAGLSHQSVAEAIGVSHPTISFWKRNPVFREALAKEIGVDATLHKFELVRLYGKAMQRVDDLLDSRNEHIRLQAARLVMEAHAASVKLAEEQEMLVALERRMDELQAAATNGQQALPPEVEDAEFEDVPGVA